jgi:ATP-dependent RNA circularization protein (DNA/RNA ligase family)
MSEFFRFPHTPHVAWLGPGEPRDDKLLSATESRQLLSGPLHVEEKLDGANVGLSVGVDGRLRAQNRGQYLEPPYSGQFSRLAGWLAMREAALIQGLGDGLILFGEWCAAQHSTGYDGLPDWFLAFDVYQLDAGRFWSVERRDALCADLGLAVVPSLGRGHTSLKALSTLVMTRSSCFGPGPVEGIITRRDNGDWLMERAKLVRPGFAQAIDTHWRHRSLSWNRLSPRAMSHLAGGY